MLESPLIEFDEKARKLSVRKIEISSFFWESQLLDGIVAIRPPTFSTYRTVRAMYCTLSVSLVLAGELAERCDGVTSTS